MIDREMIVEFGARLGAVDMAFDGLFDDIPHMSSEIIALRFEDLNRAMVELNKEWGRVLAQEGKK
jgi:hypothetical protein